jgi:catechol 2,3-dioxygenase-like lactoylglutathione lyase family enzyme
MTTVPRFGSVVLDCPDPEALAGFYARLLDWPAPQVQDGNWWATIAGPGVKVEFQRADDYQAPTWPKPERQQMFHLDLTVEDLPAAHDRVLELGATHLDTQDTFRVYADPAGHPFCLCAC